MTSRRISILDRVMNEHIAMPGCPQLIVTRGQAWHMLAALGYETDTRKTRFGSVDYMVMSKHETDEPLSDDAFREMVFAEMRRTG
jgi:hypothetical protein